MALEQGERPEWSSAGVHICDKSWGCPMRRQILNSVAVALTTASLLSVPACSGGGGDTPTPRPTPTPTISAADRIDSEAEAVRLLQQATFGPEAGDAEALNGQSTSGWFRAQIAATPTYHTQTVLARVTAAAAMDEDLYSSHSDEFWRAAAEEDDQLRQRMAFALSQILVVSDDGDLFGRGVVMADYMDLLAEHAFGNYRDLLEAVTYSPAMATYLTYLANVKADPYTGRMPDENYAREIMQLFSIGLVELEMDGSVRTGEGGEPIETYTNDDVRGLAKVFTGLSLKGSNFWDWYENSDEDAAYSRMEMFDDFHSEAEKNFLGVTIPAGTSGDESISLALDALIAHDNTPPFVARQLIQRFTTSHPSPQYIQRVATAFANGSYTLLDGSQIGEGRRGDLAATLAAVLMDEDAINPDMNDPSWGRVREPILRFLLWARAVGVNNGDATELGMLQWSSFPDMLGQHPYRSPSVFNFYRPGYVAPGTATGNAGLTAPELQTVNASTVIGYASYMDSFQRGWAQRDYDDQQTTGFVPQLDDESEMADDPQALVDHLDLVLTGERLETSTKDRIIGVLGEMTIRADEPSTEEDEEARDRRNRVNVAVNMVLTTPEFLVQR